jgi:hypothetical protein
MSNEDTARAVQAGGRLDHLLLMLILTHLNQTKIPNSVAERLDTFAGKRTMAQERHLIDEAVVSDLTLVNDVRAVFAHAEVPITFHHWAVAEAADVEVGTDVRRMFDEAADRAERAIEKRRSRIVYERTLP